MNKPKKTKRKFDQGGVKSHDQLRELLRRPPTQDEYDALRVKLRATEKAEHSLRNVLSGVSKEVHGLRRTLNHEIKLRQDMHNGVQAAKESLAQVRSIHVPWDEPGRLLDKPFCSGCGHEWPCPTIEAIREPEQLVITSLMEMKLELESSLEAQSSTKEHKS